MNTVGFFKLLISLLLHLAISAERDPRACIFSQNNNQSKACEYEEKSLQVTWVHYKNRETEDLISETGCLLSNSTIITNEDDSAYKKCESSLDQFSKNEVCPDDLTEIPSSPLCVYITNKSVVWSDRFCLGSDSIIDLIDEDRNSLYKYLSSVKNISTFWMPYHRADDNRYNPLVSTLPGKNYNSLFTKFIYNETLDKSCLIAKVTSKLEFEMSHCKEETHHSVCVYRKEQLSIKSACPGHYRALRYRPNICYGISENMTTDTVLFPTYLKNRNTFRTNMALIGVGSEEYFLMKKLSVNNDDMDYNLVMNRKEEFKVTVANDTEHLKFYNLITKGNETVKMFLKFEPKLKRLELTVYNKNFIWRIDEKDSGISCFNSPRTQASPIMISKKIFEIPEQNETIFRYKVEDYGTISYYCEAHTVFSFQKVRSEVIFAENHPPQGHNFVMFFDLPCDFGKCHKFNDNKDWQQFNTLVKETLNKLKKIPMEITKFKALHVHSVKIANVQTIKEDFSKITLLCHVRASIEVENKTDDWNSHINVKNLLIDLLKLNNGTSSTVNSTEFCIEEVVQGFPNNYWMTAGIGQTSTTTELCLQPNGLPLIRRCVGNFLYGASWEQIDSQTPITCVQSSDFNSITRNLIEIEHSQSTNNNSQKSIRDLREMLSTSLKTLIPADIFYLSKIFGGVSSEDTPSTSAGISKGISNIKETWTTDVISILNSLMDVNRNVVRLSAKLNSTNVLLEEFEEAIDNSLRTTTTLDNSDSLSEMTNNSNDGVRVFVAPNVIVFSIDPKVANITGVALYKTTAVSTDIVDGRVFQDNVYKYLYSNQSAEELLESKDLQWATFVPKTLLHRLDKNFVPSQNLSLFPPNIVIKIFANDVLFQEDRIVTNIEVIGQIFSISVPGFNTDLPEFLPLIMKSPTVDNDTEAECRYWNYKTWASDGLKFQGNSLNGNDLVWYGSSHMGQFAHVIIKSKSDYMVITSLDPITAFGCMLSMLGVIGIFIATVCYKKNRETMASKFLFQLSMAVGVQMILYCFTNTGNYRLFFGGSYTLGECIAIGAGKQYSVLVQFCLMMIIALLQYNHYFKNFINTSTNHFFIKSILFGWGLPLIPVALTVNLGRQSYIPLESSDSTICYPQGLSFYLGILLPIALVIIGNLIIIVYTAMGIPMLSNESLSHDDVKRALLKIKLSFLLFLLLILTWILGLLTATKAGLFFSYLFFIDATLEVFVLSLNFMIRDPVLSRTRNNDYATVYTRNTLE